ncbi:hypothetical protein MSTO_43880 [Mycobacterium stomatepiae]|uniref:Uncharacterized protein n=2 Tax=Mycobacterium stomatepiae TaxID=470076 RepID=A0A7I7QCZ1_9MYCO|nr:hypothetical protein MSTO_43880 [Mycobacterium stomatepiae]
MQESSKDPQPGDWVEVVAPRDNFNGKAGRVVAIVDDGDGFDVIVKIFGTDTWGIRRDKLRKISQPKTTPSPQQLDLAYEAGQNALSAQDTTLGNIRTRANTLLSTSALFVSFSAGLGLISADHTKGPVLSAPKAIVLLLVVLTLGVCVLSVLWPVDFWIFSISARKLMLQSNSDTKEELQAYLLRELTQGITQNQAALEAKQRAFRCAATLLMVEIVLLVSFITIWK